MGTSHATQMEKKTFLHGIAFFSLCTLNFHFIFLCPESTHGKHLRMITTNGAGPRTTQVSGIHALLVAEIQVLEPSIAASQGMY